MDGKRCRYDFGVNLSKGDEAIVFLSKDDRGNSKGDLFVEFMGLGLFEKNGNGQFVNKENLNLKEKITTITQKDIEAMKKQFQKK